MITVFVHQNGQTRIADRVEPAWLDASSPVTLWADLAAPGDEERRLLVDGFRFHPLSVEDAVSALQFPKIEPYQGGMNIPLPHFPGGEGVQFWWVTGIMVGLIAAMLAFFRRNKWI
jgi:Mg2+ and Co2+ transporter CorA